MKPHELIVPACPSLDRSAVEELVLTWKSPAGRQRGQRNVSLILAPDSLAAAATSSGQAGPAVALPINRRVRFPVAQ